MSWAVLAVAISLGISLGCGARSLACISETVREESAAWRAVAQQGLESVREESTAWRVVVRQGQASALKFVWPWGVLFQLPRVAGAAPCCPGVDGERPPSRPPNGGTAARPAS